MNIFGFLATVCGCAAGLGAVWMLTRKPITFKVIRSTETPRLVEPPKANPAVQTISKLDMPSQPHKKAPVEYISMDAVIKNANELMGITVPDAKEDK